MALSSSALPALRLADLFAVLDGVPAPRRSLPFTRSVKGARPFGATCCHLRSRRASLFTLLSSHFPPCLRPFAPSCLVFVPSCLRAFVPFCLHLLCHRLSLLFKSWGARASSLNSAPPVSRPLGSLGSSLVSAAGASRERSRPARSRNTCNLLRAGACPLREASRVPPCLRASVPSCLPPCLGPSVPRCLRACLPASLPWS